MTRIPASEAAATADGPAAGDRGTGSDELAKKVSVTSACIKYGNASGPRDEAWGANRALHSTSSKGPDL